MPDDERASDVQPIIGAILGATLMVLGAIYQAQVISWLGVGICGFSIRWAMERTDAG